MTQTTTGDQRPTSAKADAERRAADRRSSGLSSAQLRALAEEVYQLLRDEARLTLERQGN